jgi:hypothetical protein
MMRFSFWWAGLPLWLRYGIAAIFLLVLTVSPVAGTFWPVGWAVGVVLLLYPVCATNHSEPRRLKQAMGVVLFVAAGVMAARLGAELVYRLDLFLDTYGAKPGLNHIDDGSFLKLYAWGVTGTLAAVAGALVTRRRFAWLLAVGTTATHLAIGLSFLAMHHNGALVEYGEWCKLYGP